MLKKLPLAVLVAATAGLLPAAAFADGRAAPTGREFGQHVVQCAHMMGGFTAAHNPGMHQGFAGWDGMTCAP